MIVCAALRLKDDENIVLGGVRHGFIYSVAHNLLPGYGVTSFEEGFLDHNGDFLDRFDALQEAWRCGQLSATVREYKRDNGEAELYSEDLY